MSRGGCPRGASGQTDKGASSPVRCLPKEPNKETKELRNLPGFLNRRKEGLQSLCENPVLHVIQRSHRRRGISHCQENAQGEIPRFARNESLNEVFTQTLKPCPSSRVRTW